MHAALRWFLSFFFAVLFLLVALAGWFTPICGDGVTASFGWALFNLLLLPMAVPALGLLEVAFLGALCWTVATTWARSGAMRVVLSWLVGCTSVFLLANILARLVGVRSYCGFGF